MKKLICEDCGKELNEKEATMWLGLAFCKACWEIIEQNYEKEKRNW